VNVKIDDCSGLAEVDTIYTIIVVETLSAIR
jgi:hypothetical protein